MKNKISLKQVILGVTAGVILGSSLVFAGSYITTYLNDEIKVVLNGNLQNFKDETTGETQYPITYQNRTYLPLRTLANLLGFNVDYDENSNTAILNTDEDTISIKDQGVFAAGGTVLTTEGTFDPVNGQYNPVGQTHHADHASVFYQIPTNYNGYSMVYLHGYGQSRTGWMTTPDGRDGWSDIFLKKGYGEYLVDQPRRGDAGQSSVSGEISNITQDQAWFTQFRLGRWPNFNEGSQFPQDEESINQFFRQMTPDTGAFDARVITDALVATFEKSGKGILVSHSQGGIPAWNIMAEADNAVAHVAIEPGGFVFPESLDEEKYGQVFGARMSDEDFAKMIEKPIIVYFGDYIPEEQSDLNAENFWASVLRSARLFEQVVNDMGGDCTVVYLPDEGITGNSHFMFQELNNDVIADHIENWLIERGLN